MNKKAQLDNVGLVFGAFITIIVGLAIFSGAILPSIGSVTQTATRTNETVTVNVAANATTNFPNNVQAVLGTPVFSARENCALNKSTNISPGNFTVLSNRVIDGTLTATIQLTDTGRNQACVLNTTKQANANLVNVTYTLEPLGFIENAGARSLTLLIAIFVALAILVVAIIPSLRMGVADMFR